MPERDSSPNASSDSIPIEPRAIPRAHPEYPEGLGDLRDPPSMLYVRGTLPRRARAVAIVGSRAASSYGVEQARILAADLARVGVAIVSGLARGIDAAAHRGALEVDGATVAVLPGPIDEIAPMQHAELSKAIVRRGAIVTEIPPGIGIRPGMFVRRNRLIAALASAVVVVEAGTKSGALSTASFARSLRRTLFAVPGDVDRPTSRGCHALIRSGARICERAADVLASMREPVRDPGSSAPEERILDALDDNPRSVESLAGTAGLTLESAVAALLRLEWASLAAAHPGQRWARASRREA